MYATRPTCNNHGNGRRLSCRVKTCLYTAIFADVVLCIQACVSSEMSQVEAPDAEHALEWPAPVNATTQQCNTTVDRYLTQLVVRRSPVPDEELRPQHSKQLLSLDETDKIICHARVVGLSRASTVVLGSE